MAAIGTPPSTPKSSDKRFLFRWLCCTFESQLAHIRNTTISDQKTIGLCSLDNFVVSYCPSSSTLGAPFSTCFKPLEAGIFSSLLFRKCSNSSFPDRTSTRYNPKPMIRLYISHYLTYLSLKMSEEGSSAIAKGLLTLASGREGFLSSHPPIGAFTITGICRVRREQQVNRWC